MLSSPNTTQLKKLYFAGVEKTTPTEIKRQPIIDINNPGEIELVLNKEKIAQWQLWDWLANYEKEARVSTAGIRGAQNILYHWDSRFPLNQVGVALATLAKALVLKEKCLGKELHKIVAGEVRYNTKQYIDLISRIQAAQGITVHQPINGNLTTVWMVSFLIFMNDFAGGEYVTSSHAVSSKIATKDLDEEGSQFMPEMSLAFVEKIKEILQQAEKSSYVIKLSRRDDPKIKPDFNGYDEYVNYLKNGVATPTNLQLIQRAGQNGFRLMFDLVGGAMHQTMSLILERLGILDIFDWLRPEPDPFFHGVGKIIKDGQFFDLSCDACLMEVVETMGYEKILEDKPLGYLVLITDPDGDRLVIGQVEAADRAAKLDDLGINYLKIDNKKIVAVYHPTYSFLATMDFQMRSLQKAGLWDKHSRFMVTTTSSSRAWDEWARANNIAVVTTPTGIKEIAMVIKKVEKQILAQPHESVVVTDIWGAKVNLGIQPRLIFAGEESGGMIIGLEEVVRSAGGRVALAMREKSAGEAAVITTALAAYLFEKKMLFSDYLREIFRANNIKHQYYIRSDITYYNESQPDPVKMAVEKARGERRRNALDTFYLGLTVTLLEKKITIGQARRILIEALPSIDFSQLQNIRFTGDASYFEFPDFFVQVRRSGTDAKLRGYAGGGDKEKISRYLDALVHYAGEKTTLYEKLIPTEYQNQEKIYQKQEELYQKYFKRGL